MDEQKILRYLVKIAEQTDSLYANLQTLANMVTTLQEKVDELRREVRRLKQ